MIVAYKKAAAGTYQCCRQLQNSTMKRRVANYGVSFTLLGYNLIRALFEWFPFC